MSRSKTYAMAEAQHIITIQRSEHAWGIIGLNAGVCKSLLENHLIRRLPPGNIGLFCLMGPSPGWS